LCLLSTRIEGDRILPRYLGERDQPWLRALLNEHARFVGQRRNDLLSRLTEPLPVTAPKNKLRLATRVLDRLTLGRIEAEVSPELVRQALFRAAAASDDARAAVLERVASELGSTPPALERALFADLRSERRVAALPDDFSPLRLASEINSALVAGLLARATHVRIRAWGDPRALVRQARLGGLICLVSRDSEEESTGVLLDISGPFALFRRTAVYGRALAALVPRLTSCDGFELVASCVLSRGNRTWTVLVRSGDPIAAGRELPRFDSPIEARFAADFARAALDWELISEPAPLSAGDMLVFPDFELVHRNDPERRWSLELVGFWTREYLEKKLEQLRAAKISRLILCVDEKKSCGSEQAPDHAQLLRYRRRIDPAAVLAIIDR
jgi:predicted nuclease of restriction endonuclease-like RecB superfamily